jgi:ubiquitin-conjugating enzyme E2 J2
MITPNGRFKTNTRLCLSISDFHPDTWNPAWSVGTILTGLLSFMLEKSPTLGSLETNDLEKRTLAYKSIEFNLKDKIVQELFPEIVEEMKQIVVEREKNCKKGRDSIQANVTNSSGNSTYGENNNSSTVNNVLATAVVAVGFAVFAVVVRYVMTSITYE